MALTVIMNEMTSDRYLKQGNIVLFVQSQPKDGDFDCNNHSDSANGIICITDCKISSACASTISSAPHTYCLFLSKVFLLNKNLNEHNNGRSDGSA